MPVGFSTPGAASSAADLFSISERFWDEEGKPLRHAQQPTGQESGNETAAPEVLVDSAAALLVRDPGRFDVIVTTNMFGDILSDLASEISGGLGLAGSLNRGAKHAVAQAQHGSAPDIAGQNCANPTSLIRSAAMLLLHLGANRAAALLTACLNSALSEPKNRTKDLGGPLGTQDFALHLASQIRKKTR